MGRAGGSSGGSRSSGSSHSFSSSRSGSGHSFSSSGRSGHSSHSSSGSSHSSVDVSTDLWGEWLDTPDGVSLPIKFGATFVVILVILLGISLHSSRPSGLDDDGITRSTYNRTPLAQDWEWDGEVLTDDLGLVYAPYEVSSASLEFYHQTGVVPYLCLIDSDSRYSDAPEMFAYQWYHKYLPNDSYLLLFYNGSREEFAPNKLQIVFGSRALTLFDDEAQTILRDYLAYWGQGRSDVGFIVASALSDTSLRIMEKTPASFMIEWGGLIPAIAIGINLTPLLFILVGKFRRS